MKKERRWLKSAIKAAGAGQVSMPFHRSSRRTPAAFKPDAPALRHRVNVAQR